ncbi:unnamed protein product [Zymoseptoria tritici ST99CH_3D1]|nr:unnamed protein product [Zymoseptoria tritici ST99CH_3D1]
MVGTPNETVNALLLGIQTRRVEMVQLMLDHGANANLLASRGVQRTPLQEASALGCNDIVDLLIMWGADVNARPCQRNGRTAFQYAAENGYIGTAQLLLKHGADFQSPAAPVGGRTSIEAAAEHGRFDMVTFLLKLGTWPVSQLEKAARYARENGHTAVATLVEAALLQTGMEEALGHGMLVPCPAGQDEIEQTAQLEELIDSGTDMLDHAVLETVELLEQDSVPEDLDFEAAVDTNNLAERIPSDPVEDGSEQSTDDVSITAQGTANHRYFCNPCRRPFSNLSALKRHRRTMHKTGHEGSPFSCRFCDKNS